MLHSFYILKYVIGLFLLSIFLLVLMLFVLFSWSVWWFWINAGNCSWTMNGLEIFQVSGWCYCSAEWTCSCFWSQLGEKQIRLINFDIKLIWSVTQSVMTGVSGSSLLLACCLSVCLSGSFHSDGPLIPVFNFPNQSDYCSSAQLLSSYATISCSDSWPLGCYSKISKYLKGRIDCKYQTNFFFLLFGILIIQVLTSFFLSIHFKNYIYIYTHILCNYIYFKSI